MNQHFAHLLVASLALVVAAPQPRMSGSSIPHPATNLEILVDGAPVRRYVHEGRWYIEAIKGREYAIQLRNPHPVRVAVALSVDGLNTIDARETTAAAARKWVVNPYETIIISGWQTSKTQARRFEFTTEERSYGQALGKTANLGVISAVFFKERAVTMMAERSNDDARNRPEQAPRVSGSAGDRDAAAASPAGEAKRADNEYAATGMGRATGHAVTQVWLDIEATPAQTVNIRYEFRPQLVRLGILPRATETDPLQRRERARGFEPGFSPEPPRHR